MFRRYSVHAIDRRLGRQLFNDHAISFEFTALAGRWITDTLVLMDFQQENN